MSLKTPLHSFHAAHGCRFVEFGGWEMPVSYTGILEEHTAVRQAVGLFDASHMGEFRVSGTAAADFLDYMLTNMVKTLPTGKAVYSPMCQPDGGVVDDLIVYRTGASDFLICVNASNIDKDFVWLQQHSRDFDVTLENQSSRYALLALQGPKAEELLNAQVDVDLAQLKRFQHTQATLQDCSVRVSRTGYTGEDGFEIYCTATDATDIAECLVKAGQPFGLKLCGLGARDSLRLEAGYPLYGHEISTSINPLQGGIGWTVKFQKPDFIGKAALKNCSQSEVNPRIVYFTLEGRRIAREGAPVLCDGNKVGAVVSGTLSPILNQPIGAALIDFTQADTDTCYTELRGHRLPLNISRPPLHLRR